MAPSLKMQPLPVGEEQTQLQSWVQHTTQLTDYFTAYPLSETEFGQMGKRTQFLKDWMKAVESISSNVNETTKLSANIQRLALSMFPFIRNPKAETEYHLNKLRSSYVSNSKGIVLPVGLKSFRYACHLIINLRKVLGSKLPIQVAYAGEDDLPENYRVFIQSLGPDISTFNVLDIFNDTTIDLANGGWAIKSFALLGSIFEQAIHVDADAVFLQKPEALFENPEFQETGTFLFHDRLLWPYAFPERHEWWEQELAHMDISNTTKFSKVYGQGYAEEGDSGVVVVDKSRIDVLAGLLHICWQNSKAPRDTLTYTMGYGDKESWWFGFELSGTPYSMEKHYAAVLGEFVEASDEPSTEGLAEEGLAEEGLAEEGSTEEESSEDGMLETDLLEDELSKRQLSKEGPSVDRVCSFGIAHIDREDELLWFNGSLLKNKRVNETEYYVPKVWMVDGEWEKGADHFQPSCMKGSRTNWCSKKETEILKRSVEEAKNMDQILVEQFPGIMEVYTNQAYEEA